MHLKKLEYIILLFLAWSFFSCVEEQLKSDKKDTITGKWKLEKIQSGIIYDCTQYNVVFDFKKDGALTVSGKTDQMGQLYMIPAGEYLYLLKDYRLRIKGNHLFQGKSDFWYNFDSKETCLRPAWFNDDMTDNELEIDGGIILWYITKIK